MSGKLPPYNREELEDILTKHFVGVAANALNAELKEEHSPHTKAAFKGSKLAGIEASVRSVLAELSLDDLRAVTHKMHANYDETGIDSERIFPDFDLHARKRGDAKQPPAAPPPPAPPALGLARLTIGGVEAILTEGPQGTRGGRQK